MARPAQGKPPADVIGDAVKPDGVVADTEPEKRVKRAAAELGSRGGKARAARMTPEKKIGDRSNGGEKKMEQATLSAVKHRG